MNSIENKNNSLLVPRQEKLLDDFNIALKAVDDIVLKNYITSLKDLEVVPLDSKTIEQNISDNVRFFKITEMVYEKDEYSTYKFASVFNALSTANCAVFIIIDSDGSKTDFYMGIRSLNSDRTTNSLKETLKNSLIGQFPGIKSKDYLYEDMKNVLEGIHTSRISSVSCVANIKDSDIKSNQCFIQGLEKLALSMQGEKYTGIILANSTPQNKISDIRREYENIYTQLSPFASSQVSYATNSSLNVSKAYTSGTSKGTTYTTTKSTSTGQTSNYGTGTSSSTSSESGATKAIKGLSAVSGMLGAALTPLIGPGGLVIGGLASGALGFLGTAVQKTATNGTTTNSSNSTSKTDNFGVSDGISESRNESNTNTKGIQSGTSQNITLNIQNKSIANILERIDTQLNRLNEFESLGMWECAAYFMSDSGYVADIAASTYKALMRGENSGVEVSAINSWGRFDGKKTKYIGEYVKNFIHPVFSYKSLSGNIPVTPSSIVSGNELAIHMGLPRKSVCGFPVIEHADFGKETINYDGERTTGGINLGKVFNMGSECKNRVRLDRNSLSMHTFISGSTGSGKSNTVYEILRQLDVVDIPFMVIEPAKGEYKNIFGNRGDVAVLGTNPAYSDLLKINPFKFPPSIHILEHIDRLIEIFNVCWPMYAAMPAVLKDAVLQSYEVCGWDLVTSENRYSNDLFPTFNDLQAELINVIENSAYSEELKSNYIGSLATRVKSLTNGLNGQIFSCDETDNELLFNKNVIIDLSRIGSLETKSLIMGILVMRLNEHRIAYSNGMNLPLKHVTVLEEAHNILKKSDSIQGPEGSNVSSKSVEMLSNSIAEMRTYGEGFIIVDQSPSAVDISAIRNTNAKIIMRLPEESDRRLAGKAAALKDSQLDEISKLPKGVAVVYQNDWLEPVLCKIKKFEGEEEAYIYNKKEKFKNIDSKFKKEIINLLLCGRLVEKVEVDIDYLSENIDYASISTKNKIGLHYIIDEYKKSKKLDLWNDNKFSDLSEIVTNLLINKSTLDSTILKNENLKELNRSLENLIDKEIPNASDQIKLSICQCFMKEFSKGNSNKLEVYSIWYEDVKNRGVL